MPDARLVRKFSLESRGVGLPRFGKHSRTRLTVHFQVSQQVQDFVLFQRVAACSDYTGITLTQVNSLARLFWQPAKVTAMKLDDMRVHYDRDELRGEDLCADPFEQFARWVREACGRGLVEPNAMSLATAGADGRPTLRTVLLKGFDERGFVFYTNLESRKTRQMSENANVSLLFPWLALHRQVAVNGVAERVPTSEALAYFASRPFGSQIGAWASPQSRVVSTRALLEMKWEEAKRKFQEGRVPMPSFWGGFRVVPRDIEFWQGRGHRLHDRFLYTRTEEENWKIERLAP